MAPTNNAQQVWQSFDGEDFLHLLGVQGGTIVGYIDNTGSLHTTGGSGGGASYAPVISSATPPTTRVVDSEPSITGTSVAVAGDGSIAAIRGNVTVATGTTITAGYLYGVQGKITLKGTLDTVLGEYQAAVVAQLDTSAATAVTSGNLSALWVDGGASTALGNGKYNMINVTNTVAANAGAVLSFAGNATDLFVLNTDNAISGSFLRPVTTVSSMVGSLAISYWNGSSMVTGYLPIYSS